MFTSRIGHGPGWWGLVIELSAAIRELRRELDEATASGLGERLRFELRPVELEVAVGLELAREIGAKVRFWLLELAGDSQMTRSWAQRIRLVLQPPLAETGATPWVSSAEEPHER